MSGASSSEKQDLQEIEGSDEKAKLEIEAQEVKDIDEEECKTPTCSVNQISAIQNCPPPPRKRRRTLVPTSSHSIARSLSDEFRFFEDSAPEVEFFFQSIKKRSKSI